MGIIGKIKLWLYGLSGVWSIVLFFIMMSLISWGLPEFFGKKYSKFYPNEYYSSWAVSKFKSVCEGSYSNTDESGVEYYKFYDSRGEAVNDFMILARMFDSKYANGKFRHLYIPRKERIYQCWDTDNKLIAIHYIKHRGTFYFGSWEKPTYEIEFYVERY